MSRVTELSQLHSALPMKCLPVPGEKINIVLMRVVPLIMPILRSAEHISNFVRSCVRKLIAFSNTLWLDFSCQKVWKLLKVTEETINMWTRGRFTNGWRADECWWDAIDCKYAHRSAYPIQPNIQNWWNCAELSCKEAVQEFPDTQQKYSYLFVFCDEIRKIPNRWTNRIENQGDYILTEVVCDFCVIFCQNV